MIVWAAIVTGCATVIAAGLALRAAVLTARNQRETSKVQASIDGFDRLTERHEREIERLDRELNEEREITKALAGLNERLTEENRMLREGRTP